MSNHYYSEHPFVEHDRKLITASLRGTTLKFVTDAGVFSKGGIDYGSRLLIETMEVTDGSHVLDMGCGYGPIGLFAAALWNRCRVTLVDKNSRAVELARENARLNGLENVRVMQSDLYAGVAHDTFDTVLTNPPIRAGKSVVFQIYEGALPRLKPGGELWVVIQKKQGAPSTLAKLESLFASVSAVHKSKGYWILRAVKAAEHA
jgi:16S rRNA (guanine1207-N2)-methyltransferase